MNKIIRNSILSIFFGIVISIVACYLGTNGELINYVGAMFVLGGLIFLDQWIVGKIFVQGTKIALVRLLVYLLFAIVLILLPLWVEVAPILMRILRSFGIGFMLLAFWRFFTFTTVEEEKIHKNK